MPINSCSSNGKPGYRFGESGKCYTYTPGNSSERTDARMRARMQEVAARASGWNGKSIDERISLMTQMFEEFDREDQMEDYKMEANSYVEYTKTLNIMEKQCHDMMKVHSSLAASYSKAASWHMKKMEQVNTMLETMKSMHSGEDVCMPGDDNCEMNDDMNDMEMFSLSLEESENKYEKSSETKLSDLISILKDHQEEYGTFDIPVEDLASMILAIGEK